MHDATLYHVHIQTSEVSTSCGHQVAPRSIFRLRRQIKRTTTARKRTAALHFGSAFFSATPPPPSSVSVNSCRRKVHSVAFFRSYWQAVDGGEKEEKKRSFQLVAARSGVRTDVFEAKRYYLLSTRFLLSAELGPRQGKANKVRIRSLLLLVLEGFAGTFARNDSRVGLRRYAFPV